MAASAGQMALKTLMSRAKLAALLAVLMKAVAGVGAVAMGDGRLLAQVDAGIVVAVVAVHYELVLARLGVDPHGDKGAVGAELDAAAVDRFRVGDFGTDMIGA